MVRVVSRVMDGHVLENFVICSNDVVCLGLGLSSVPLNSPCGPVFQPRLLVWEEVQTYIHQTRHRYFVRNGLRQWCAFQLRQVGIDIASHHDLGPVRSIPDGRSGILYG